MKSASQKNDFAGSAAQKLPPDQLTAPALAGAEAAIPAPKSRTPTSFSDPREFSPQWMVLDTTAKGLAAPTLTTNVQAGSAPSSAALAQVERLIGREVLLLRDSGAQALAVSLKVDSQTSLFLQLTNHHGQIEVAVRCEEATPPPWTPTGGNCSNRSPAKTSNYCPWKTRPLPPASLPIFPRKHPAIPSTGRPPSIRRRGRPPPNQKNPVDHAMNAAVGVSKSKSKSRHYRGWEKWA